MIKPATLAIAFFAATAAAEAPWSVTVESPDGAHEEFYAQPFITKTMTVCGMTDSRTLNIKVLASQNDGARLVEPFLPLRIRKLATQEERSAATQSMTAKEQDNIHAMVSPLVFAFSSQIQKDLESEINIVANITNGNMGRLRDLLPAALGRVARNSILDRGQGLSTRITATMTPAAPGLCRMAEINYNP